MKIKFNFAICTLIISFILAGAIALAEDIPNGDETASEMSSELIKALGIADTGISNNDNITKGDYVKYILNMLGKKTEPAEKQIFFDVEINNKYASYINTAYYWGLINGDEEGNVGAERPLSMDEALIIAVRALNCGGLAETSGGYSGVAGKLNLYDNLKIADTDSLTFAEAAVLIKNALETEYLSAEDGKDYSFSGHTMLEDIFRLTKVTGVVEGCYTTDIYGDSRPSRGHIIIDGNMYLADDAAAKRNIGCRVTAYYDKDDDSISYMYLRGNAITNIDVIDFQGCSNGNLTYISSNGKEKDISLSSDAVTVLNGKRISSSELKTPKYGNVSAIDNNKDGKIDVVLVNGYDIGIVEGKNTSDEKIYLKNGYYKIPDLSEVSDYRIYAPDGKISDLDSITEDMLINVYNYDDVIEIFEYTDTIEIQVKGMCDGIDDCGSYTLTDQNGENHETVLYFDDICDENILEIGNTYTFVLNKDGRIAGIITRNNTSGEVMGYLLRVWNDEMGGDRAYLKVFTQDGVFEDIKSADKIRVINPDGTLKPSQLVSVCKKGIIKYKKNSSGEISKITFPNEDSTVGEGFRLQYDDNVNNSTLSTIAENRYSNTYQMIGTFIPLNKYTRVFIIPDEQNEDKLEWYSSIVGTKLTNGSYYPSVKSYICDNSDIFADAILIRQRYASSTLSKYSPIMMIDKIYSVYDEKSDGEKISISGMQSGSRKDVVLYDAALLNYSSGKDELTFSEGDIVRYTTDINGEITYIQPVYDFDKKQLYNHSGNIGEETKKWGDAIANLGGNVESTAEGMYIRMVGDNSYYPITSSTNIYKFESENKSDKISVIGINDIPTEKREEGSGAYVVIIARDSSIPFLGVYENQ